MRQQEFSAMRAVEANIAQQQGQLQMEMVQMERQMDQLGQTTQREEALLRQVQAGQRLPQQPQPPAPNELMQNSPMQGPSWGAQLPQQPQLHGQTLQGIAPPQAGFLQPPFPQQPFPQQPGMFMVPPQPWIQQLQDTGMTPLQGALMQQQQLAMGQGVGMLPTVRAV